MPCLLGVYVILRFRVMLIDYWTAYKERFLVIVIQKILTRIVAPFTEASVYFNCILPTQQFMLELSPVGLLPKPHL